MERKASAHRHPQTSIILVVGLFTGLYMMFAQSLWEKIIFNIAAVNCTKALISGTFCEERFGAVTQLSASSSSTFDFINALITWHRHDYEQLAHRCTDGTLCGCIDADYTGAKSSFHRRLIAFYAVLSYKILYNVFPQIETCSEHFVPSSYLANQSEIYKSLGNTDLEWIARELAYLIDRGWQAAHQRGGTAYWQGLKYLTKGKYKEAIRAFSVAAESFSKSDLPGMFVYKAQSLALLGKARYLDGDTDGALDAYKQSIMIDPKGAAQGRVNAFFELIVVWRSQGRDVSDMVYDFDRIIAADPANPYLTSETVGALLMAGMLKEAENILDASSPDILDFHAVIGMRGRLAEAQGDTENAVVYYRRALIAANNQDSLAAEEWASRLQKLETELSK